MGCKHNKNSVFDTPFKSLNHLKTIGHYSDDDIIENNLSCFIYEKPVVIIKDENKFLLFPNSYIISISEKYCKYNIDYIKIYSSNNKDSQYIDINNEDVFLFKLPENNNWLYCYVSDFIHGYLYVYDISKESFYGNFDDNRESGDTYKILLIDEYILLNKYSNIKRYGPLLEIKYNHKVINFWDSFTGEDPAGEYHFQLLNYFEKYNEILIRKQFYESSANYIYNIQLADYVREVKDISYFTGKP